ncbi:MAG: DUF368 domain-containing protein, partial [Planctomycetota bacterium]
ESGLSEDTNTPAENVVTLVSRSIFGGVLMGLANLVPGISGGTMLLAAGIYPAFIRALSDLTRFKFRFRSILILVFVGLAAGVGIFLLAGTLTDLVIGNRWLMYSLFIGLTLGGVPVVWKLARPGSTAFVGAAGLSFFAMATLAILQMQGVVGSIGSGFGSLLIAGLAGASAMILPGLSGAYLLLLLGQYIPILKGVDQFKDALSVRDFSAAMDPAFSIMLPVGIGVVIGVVAVGNLLEWMLRRCRQITLGILLGLLIGSTVGLYPFQEGVKPELGSTLKNQIVTEEFLAELEPEDYPNQVFRPTPFQIASSVGLVVLGFAVTIGVTKIGGEKNENPTASPSTPSSPIE